MKNRVEHRIYAFLLFLSFFFLTIMSCGQSYEEKRRLSRAELMEQKKADSLALKLAVLPTLDALPIYLAKEYHLFDTLGLDVRLSVRNAQMDCDTTLVGGHVEGMVTDLVRAERIVRRGTPLTYLTATNAHWQLVTNHKARLKELNQLGDKMVAMTRFSATDFLTDKALQGVKTSAPVYRVQINDVLLRLQMLKNNEMDALWLPEPQATVARELSNPVIWDTKKNDVCLGVIAFREKALQDRRVSQQVELFKKAYNLACDSLNKMGVGHFADLIRKYCHVDLETIKKIPEQSFSHISEPREKDVIEARKWVGK